MSSQSNCAKNWNSFFASIRDGEHGDLEQLYTLGSSICNTNHQVCIEEECLAKGFKALEEKWKKIKEEWENNKKVSEKLKVEQNNLSSMTTSRDLGTGLGTTAGVLTGAGSVYAIPWLLRGLKDLTSRWVS